MSETVAFVLCIENNAIRDQALLLIESIRTFAGAYKDSEIIAISPRGNGIDSATQDQLGELGVRYVDLPLNQVCPEYGPANRVYSGAWAARNSSASTLIVLDSDTILFGEPELLGTEIDAAARPVDLNWASSTGPGSPLESYFEALCALAETTIDVLPFTETTIDRGRVRAIYNTGYSVIRRERGFLEAAADIFTRSVRGGLRPRVGGKEVFSSTGFVGPVASEYWGSSQAVLAIAIWARSRKVRELDRRYNVPLHLLARQKTIEDRWIGLKPVHVHYHWMLNPEHRSRAFELFSILGIAPEQLAWLSERTPLRPTKAKGGATQGGL